MTVVDGVEVKLTNLDKVMYPAVGTVKAQVVEYHHRSRRISLPSIASRLVTWKR